MVELGDGILVLNNRIIREFFENKIKYFGLILLIMISSMASVGFADSTDSIFDTVSIYFKTNNCEDGNFVLKNKIDNITLDKLKKNGAEVEENFYCDYKKDNSQTIRVYKNRSSINKVSVIDGKNISSKNEILLDDKLGEFDGYKTGDYIELNNKKYNIVGHAIAPDYTFLKKQDSDMFNNPEQFGIAFVGDEDFGSFNDKIYSYSFKCADSYVENLKSILEKNTKLISFTKAKDNSRIIGYYDDLKINKYVAVLIGTLLCLMIGFIISMVVVSIIDKENPIIGTLYSLGYVKSEILNHFMILPAVIVSIGAVLGTILGFIIQGPLGKASAGMYSLPHINISFPLYIIFMGVILPIIIVISVNYLILSRQLNRTPLQLLRKEKKQKNIKNINISFLNFMAKFKFLQLIREFKGNIMLFIGVVFAMFILILGLGMNSTINSYIDHVRKDATIAYTYLLKIPIEVNEDDNVEKSQIKSLKMYSQDFDTNMNVTLQGINRNSIFYEFNINDSDENAYISTSFANKFKVSKGDRITLKDAQNNKIYSLNVGGIVDYNIGLYVFMNREQMNEIMDLKKSSYNALLSRKKLDINQKYIYSTITSDDAIKSAENTKELMKPMQKLLIIISSSLFILIMYLLLKLIIDKSITGISLLKVFGFNRREVSSLYIGSGLYTVVLCLLFGVTVSLRIYENILWPNLISNIEAFIPVNIINETFIYLISIVLGSYFVSTLLLKHYINKISLSDALKNRE